MGTVRAGGSVAGPVDAWVVVGIADSPSHMGSDDSLLQNTSLSWTNVALKHPILQHM